MEREPDVADEPFRELAEDFREPDEELREPDEELRGPAGESYEPGGQFRALGERRPATGEPRVDAALARLDELAGRPVTEHRAIFDDVHRRLREVLGELDTRQPPQAGDAGGTASRPAR